MKKTYIFCTKWWLFLTEIPPAIILGLAIFYNNVVETPQKLYPLIAFCCLVIIFIFLYFFRLVSISAEEIRTIGLFSSKDSAVVEKDKILVFTLMPRNKMRVELDGKSNAPGFSWIKGDYEECDINLYREKAVGGKIAVARALKAFGISADEYAKIFSDREYKKDFENITISSYIDNKNRVVKIKFLNTIQFSYKTIKRLSQIRDSLFFAIMFSFCVLISTEQSKVISFALFCATEGAQIIICTALLDRLQG